MLNRVFGKSAKKARRYCCSQGAGVGMAHSARRGPPVEQCPDIVGKDGRLYLVMEVLEASINAIP